MVKKIITNILVALLIIIIISTTIFINRMLRPEYRDINTTLKGVEDIGNIEKGNVVETIINDEILFLAMGIDAESTEGYSKNGKRSDTLMLCKVNFKSGEMSILSLPRDSKVPVSGKLDKLNHSHAYGGTKLTLKTVRDFTGLDIDYYVKVDYNLVKEVVDTIGGITLDIPFNMKYDDPVANPPLHINIKKGTQLLDGKKSIEYLRWRKNNAGMKQYTDGGDLERIMQV